MLMDFSYHTPAPSAKHLTTITNETGFLPFMLLSRTQMDALTLVALIFVFVVLKTTLGDAYLMGAERDLRKHNKSSHHNTSMLCPPPPCLGAKDTTLDGVQSHGRN